MESLNKVIAKNISGLRKKAGLTQQQFAEKFNFSDKTISKWELGNAIPTVDVLKEIADSYGVTVDYLLEEHEEFDEASLKKTKRKIDNRLPILLLVNMVIFLIATVIFVWSIKNDKTDPFWEAFIFGLALSGLISAFLARKMWKPNKALWIAFTSVFCWATILSFYLLFLDQQLWYIFFVGVPVEGCIILIGAMRKA